MAPDIHSGTGDAGRACASFVIFDHAGRARAEETAASCNLPGRERGEVGRRCDSVLEAGLARIIDGVPFAIDDELIGAARVVLTHMDWRGSIIFVTGIAFCAGDLAQCISIAHIARSESLALSKIAGYCWARGTRWRGADS